MRKGCFSLRCCGLGFLVLVAVVLLAGFGAGIWVDGKISGRSNFYFLSYEGSSKPLEIKLKDGSWLRVGEMKGEQLSSAAQPLYQSDKARAWSLQGQRAAVGDRQKLASRLVSPEVYVFEFDPEKFEFGVFADRDASGVFRPLTVDRALGPSEEGFAINASYFDPNGQPLGLIIDDGQQISREYKAWSGFFFVKEGQPWFGARSLYEELPGEATEVIQGYPSVMKNHEVFHYLNKEPDRFFNGSEVTFRALGGVKEDGTVVFIVSGQAGVMTMAEITQLAKLWGVKHATLLDGGKSLQYCFRFGGTEVAFHAFNNSLEIGEYWNGRLKPERPPVFLKVTP